MLLWDVASGRSISEPLTAHEDEVSSVAFSADGTRLVSVGVTDFGSAGGKGTVRQWEVASGQPIGEPTSLPGWVSVARSVSMAPGWPTATARGSGCGTCPLVG